VEAVVKTLALTCALFLVTSDSAVASPGGLNLGWNDCGGDPATLNRTFACNTNSGINTLVGSFVTPCCITAMNSNEIVMNLQSASATWPAWWGMATGLCRPSSLSTNFDFTAGFISCIDYWQGGAVGGQLLDQIVGNRARLRAVVALPAGDSRITAIPEGDEVYSYKVNINNQKSVGGACPGCQTPVCIVLNSIKLVQPPGTPGGDKFVSAPAVRNFATWQGVIVFDCYLATPARNTTWGSIKTQYR
jgi:hypothetical protein